MAKRTVKCNNCSGFFEARRSDTLYCPGCREEVQKLRCNTRYHRMKTQELNYQKMLDGTYEFNPFFLTRGRPSRSTGVTSMEGIFNGFR